MTGEVVVGVRFGWNSPPVFCYADDARGAVLHRGRRVLVATTDGEREGRVAIAPADIIAAPPLGDVPRVVAVLSPVADDEDEDHDLPRQAVFLPADGGDLGLDDLAHALHLAGVRVPDPPPRRR